ncbi:S-layer homology domain-containing protein [candidate division KSB1 bacterium]|nr:S-layer homology domain-containing protein [candidate division KSB1 bacterium]
MKVRILLLALTVILAAFLMIGCGPKAIKQASVLDTSANHFNQGMRELDRGNYDLANQEFKRAIALNPDYAEGFAGLGLVAATSGNFEAARENIDKALSKNSESVESRIIKGRILTMERKGDDWLEKAVREFDRALQVNPRSEKAVFYKGIAYKEAFQFNDAAVAFMRVIADKGDFAAAADQEYAVVQKIQRAAPGTKAGAKVALIKEIDRADVAVLFMEELKLLDIISKKRPKTYDTGFKAPEDPTQMQTEQVVKVPKVTDIGNHWAKNWINDIVEAQGMAVFPDHTFRPDEKISRADYAMMLQNILIMATGDDGLATKYIGQESRFPDVNPSHFAYNAICLMTDRGIMHADKMTGAFDMKAHVSGADALLIIRDFQNALRMTF